MSTPLPPASARPSSFTVTSGLDLLDQWSARATQAEKNTAYRILFAVADHSVFTGCHILDDARNHMEFFVLTKGGLTIKIRIDDLDSFAILYIGPSCTAPGLDAAWSASVSSLLDSL